MVELRKEVTKNTHNITSFGFSYLLQLSEFIFGKIVPT